MRRKFYPLFVFATFILFPASFALAQSDLKPNILIVLGDDIDRDCLGPWGGQAITPNIDRMAKEGIRFNNLFANVAMCAPFRQELYSGRVAWRTRAMPNHSRSGIGTKSLPHYLRPLGYKVGLLGKSHVGPKEAYPFDFLGKLSMQTNANRDALKLARKYVTAARDAQKAFCLVVASHDGHAPYTTGDPAKYDQNALKIDSDKVDTPVYRETLAKHLAEVTNLDALVGDLRKMLVEEKLSNNTLVIFCSEQGNGFPFSKWTCFNDGLATGVIATMPGVIPEGKSCDELAWLSDIAPTLVEAAGGKFADDDFDGKSQWENFRGGNEEVHEYAYGAFCNCNILDNQTRIFPIRSIRTEQYSLIWSPKGNDTITSNVTLTEALRMLEIEKGNESNKKGNGKSVAGSWVAKSRQDEDPKLNAIVKRLHHRPEWALYDRKNDPEELNNLINDPRNADLVSKMKNDLQKWLARWKDANPVETEKRFVKVKKKNKNQAKKKRKAAEGR